MTDRRSMRRRDAIAAIVGAPIAATWGCDEHAQPIVGDLRGPSIDAGHLLRSATPRSDEAEVERVELAILGGGPSGLSAAWRAIRRGVRDVRLFELESVVGGTSIGGESAITAYPWGAHYLPVPRASHGSLVELLDELDAWEAPGVPREHLLVRAPDERVFYRGFWYRGLLPRTDLSAREHRELERFAALVAQWSAFRDAQGRRAFDLPSSRSSKDAEVLALDRVTAEEWCESHGIGAPRVRWWLEYGMRDDYGLTLAQASAWALLFYHCARREDGDSAEYLTWPNGNAALVAHLSRAIGAARIAPSSLVTRLRASAEAVEIDLFDVVRRRVRRVVAQRAICALPIFVAARVVEGFVAPTVPHGAWMVANLHLRSRPPERGFPPAWDNVIYDSPSLGYVSATHQRGRDHGPTVWTYYLPLLDPDPRRARERLLNTSWETWRDAILADLSRAHPGLPRHVTRLDVWRWGHAMAQPRPGVRSALLSAPAPATGRLQFAHSDWSGLSLFEEAFDRGVEAADAVIAARDAR